jgi:hypothetical protein
MTDSSYKDYRRDLLNIVLKKSGTPVVTLAESKGIVDKFRPEAFASSKVQVVPGNDQVFVLINDKDENLGEYLKPGAKLNWYIDSFETVMN